MKAVVVEQFGNADVLQVKDVPLPAITTDEVLVQVKAAGLNPIDWKTREEKGFLNSDDLPYIAGWDVAGIITEVGTAVSDFKVGDEVFGMLNFPKIAGTHAEYVVAQPSDIAIKPENISFEQAAALPLAGLTAWQALITEATLQPGERVLIHAAAGGVGHLAVQIAKAHGAYVIGTASADNHAFLHSLGCDQCIDYRTQEFDQELKDVDVILDSIGGEIMTRSINMLKPNGRLMTLVGHRFTEAFAQAEAQNVHAKAVIVAPSAADMRQLGALLASNQLQIVVDKAFSLDQVADAHCYLEQGHAQGKVVLTI